MKLISKIRFVFVFILASVFVGELVAQTPSLEALGRQGPYQVAWYTQLPSVPEFSGATLYFPANKAQDFGGVVISPGFFERQENISWWGNYLASHGFAVITFDTNELNDLPPLRADALLATIGLLRGENSRQGSAVRGKILEDSMAVMGHSMGGTAALLLANEKSDEIKAAIPFNAGGVPNANFSSVAVPTLVIAGELDRLAPVNDHAWSHYQTLTNEVPRMYMEVKGGNHFIANTAEVENERLRPNVDVHDLVGGMAVAWLKLFLDGEEEYRELLFGEMPSEITEQLSRFEYSK
jgi:triacylglycerol lipase